MCEIALFIDTGCCELLLLYSILMSEHSGRGRMEGQEAMCSRGGTWSRGVSVTCVYPATLSSQKWNVSQTKIRVISTIIFILFGCVLFVALPAVIFKHIEGWSALDAIYFVVITLTTIGFGDYVAGKVFLCCDCSPSQSLLVKAHMNLLEHKAV